MLVTTINDGATPVFERMVANAPGARSALIRELAEALTEHVKRAAPVGQHYSPSGASQGGGTLRDSLFFEVGPDGATLLGAAHGLYVLGGTRPHAIDARRAPALHFWWAKRGVEFVGPHVNHPGSSANDFRMKALVAAFEDATIERAAGRFWQAVVEGGG